MSYYVSPHSEDPTANVVVYRVIKRLSDFKPAEDKVYRVFKSKKAMRDPTIQLYKGIHGKLVKHKKIVRLFPDFFMSL